MLKFDKDGKSIPQNTGSSNSSAPGTDRKFVPRGRSYQSNYQQNRFQRKPMAPTDPYENSVWFLNTFNKRQVVRGFDDSNDSMLRKFKRIVEASGIIRELKKREFYQSKSQKKREKKKRALKRLRKNAKLEELIDYDSKKVFKPSNDRR